MHLPSLIVIYTLSLLLFAPFIRRALFRAIIEPPSAPVNLSMSYINSSAVILAWQPPKYLGGRNDTTYKVVCDNCDQTTATYSSNQLSNFSETKCVISNLMPQTSYRFIVFALNGVSGYDQAQSSEILVTTSAGTNMPAIVGQQQRLASAIGK